MLNGLDLFSGYGGISLALRDWVRPIVYCEIERYAQGILLSRMSEGKLPIAPIWNDVTTLDGDLFKNEIDIIYGGFPCQDISSAGLGKGLEGERSGLFREIVRLAKEIKPTFLFLENVPAIRTRGLDTVIKELTDCGYDLRWTSLSAAEVGAPHKRERWFLLANAREGRCDEPGQGKNQLEGRAAPECSGALAHSNHIGRHELRGLPRTDEIEIRSEIKHQNQTDKLSDAGKSNAIPDTDREQIRDEQQRKPGGLANGVCDKGKTESRYDGANQWWATEPDVGRVVNGCPQRVDRIKSLGNGVVPLQVQTAFKELMGLK